MYSTQLTFEMTYQDSKRKPWISNFNCSTHSLSLPTLNYSIFANNLDKNETSSISPTTNGNLRRCQEERWGKNWKQASGGNKLGRQPLNS